MAQRVEIEVVTCAAGTLQAAPTETDLTFAPGIVREVEIVIPDGHQGETGLGLAVAHQVIIPATGNNWLVGNDEVVRWPLSNYPDTGAWSAFTYNSDPTYDHSWYLRFLIDELSGQASIPPAPQPLGVGTIMAAGLQ